MQIVLFISSRLFTPNGFICNYLMSLMFMYSLSQFVGVFCILCAYHWLPLPMPCSDGRYFPVKQKDQFFLPTVAN